MVQLAAPHYNLKPIDLLQNVAPDFVDYARAVLASDRARRIDREVGTMTTICAALDTFQQAANRGTCVYLSPELVQALRAALKAEPEGAGEALAARPLLERVAAMADRIGIHTVGEITAISDRAAAWLSDNPPGQPVEIEPRGCPTPGACSCVGPTPPAPEKEEGPTLADVDELCAEFGFHYDDDQGETLEILQDMISASLARWGVPATKPVPAGDDSAWRQRLGWCNSSGECWWSSGPHGPWQLIGPDMVYPAGWVLPYRAIPQPAPEAGDPSTIATQP
jgi:hypothetical protein